MKRKIKLLVLAGAVFAFSTSLVSCMKTKGGSDGGDDVKPEDVEITLDSDYKCELSLLIPNGNENEETMIDELIREFNLDYPNITFKKNYCSVSNYENTVRNQWIAKTLPDIVWSNSPDFYSLVAQEMCLELNPYIEKSEKEGVFDFDNDFLTEYFNIGSINGKYYCFPRSADSVVCFYNKKLLTDAGIDISVIKNGWTWSDFVGILEEYRAYLDKTSYKDTYYCLDANLTGWLSVSYPILKSFGVEIIDSNKNVLIDSEATREALTLTRSLMENRYIVADSETSGSSFEIGTAPFLFQSSAISHYSERKALKGNIDIVSFPLINDKNTPQIGSGIAGYCINSRTTEKTAAWLFLNKMISKEGQNAMANGGLNLPSIRKDLQDYTSDDVNWGKGYTDYNLAAYTYGGEYKTTCDFLSLVDVKYKAKLTEAIDGLFQNTTRKDKDIESAISTCVRYLTNALK